MKLNKVKCKVCPMGRGIPKQKYRLGGEWIENILKEKYLGLLVDEKPNMTVTQRQCALAAQKANHIPG